MNGLDALEAHENAAVHRSAGWRQHTDHGKGLVTMLGDMFAAAVRERDPRTLPIAQPRRHLGPDHRLEHRPERLRGEASARPSP